MRWTVGPQPPAVYWRRRAIVAAVVILAGTLVWLGIRSAGGPGGRPGAGASSTAGAADRAIPGGTPTTPATGPSAPSASSSDGQPGFVTASAGPEPSGGRSVPPNLPACADGELTVTVSASPSPGVLGGTFTFTIVIVNGTDHWCTRDIGPGAQELRVLRDGALLFSSDDCGSDRRGDVRAFAPADAVRYRYTWSSYRVTPHDCAPAKAPAPPGTYQLIARVGSKLSPPADFSVAK